MQINNPTTRFVIGILIITLLLQSCSKSSTSNPNSNNGSGSIIAHIYNSDGSFYYSDTFKIKYLGDQCVEENAYASAPWHYYALPVSVGNYKDYIYLKNKIVVGSYSNCLAANNYTPSSDLDYKIIFAEGGTINYPYSYYAKSGILTITNVAPGSDQFGTGTKISGHWSGIAGVETANGNSDKSAELIIDNMLYYN